MHLEDVLLQIESYEDTRREAWEMVRANAYITAKYSMHDTKKIKNPQSFWRFGWEGKKGSTNPKEIMEQHLRKVELQKEMKEKVQSI